MNAAEKQFRLLYHEIPRTQFYNKRTWNCICIRRNTRRKTPHIIDNNIPALYLRMTVVPNFLCFQVGKWGKLICKKTCHEKGYRIWHGRVFSLTIRITTFCLCTVVVPSVLCSHLDTNRKSDCSLRHLYISHTLPGSRLHRNQKHSLRKVWLHYILNFSSYTDTRTVAAIGHMLDIFVLIRCHEIKGVATK